jgi:integrase
MKDSPEKGSPLRQRMLEDMRLRKLSPKTQEAYVRAVLRLAKYLHRAPDTATVKDLRSFQLHLVDCGTSPITLNATITGLKFFFDTTLDRSELMAKMKPVYVPRTLPVILSREEVGSLLAATKNLKLQTALSIAYGAGLRVSEVTAFKVGDVDSTRMTLRIQEGKGGKDRYAMLSPVMLERLRTWWRVARAQGAILLRARVFTQPRLLDGLDLLLNVFDACFRHQYRFPVSSVRLRHIPGDALIQLLHPSLKLAIREVLVAIINRLELAAVDRDHGLREHLQLSA